MTDHKPMARSIKAVLVVGGTLTVVFAFVSGCLVGCAPARSDGDNNDNHYDDKSLARVAVQEYQDPRIGGKACLVFTHDTAQGASMQVVC